MLVTNLETKRVGDNSVGDGFGHFGPTRLDSRASTSKSCHQDRNFVTQFNFAISRCHQYQEVTTIAVTVCHFLMLIDGKVPFHREAWAAFIDDFQRFSCRSGFDQWCSFVLHVKSSPYKQSQQYRLSSFCWDQNVFSVFYFQSDFENWECSDSEHSNGLKWS